MNLKSAAALMLLPVLVCSAQARAAGGRVEHLATYRQQGVEQTDAEGGRRLWYSTNGERSCATCHGDRPAMTGKHARTGKTIEPMALSLNPARYQDGKKIEKWFLRNCKWTWGRECSPQEKADILTWLASQ